MNHPIHFVSLGPGDPELITLKGLKTLQKADIIYCPATQGKHGIISRATDILKAIEVDESLIHPFILPMSKERTDALNAYNELFLDAQAEYLKGKQIVIVAEGDAGFYSSIQYVYDKFEEAGIPVDRIAGIPAFIAAGALAGIHIVKQEEQINVIPGTASFDELSAKIENGTNDITQSRVVDFANALNTTPAYLMGWEDSESQSIPTLNKKDERDIAKRLEQTLDQLESDQDGLMFSGEPLDDQTRELLKASLQNSITIAKINAKQKFTPKKYRDKK